MVKAHHTLASVLVEPIICLVLKLLTHTNQVLVNLAFAH